MEGGEGSWGGRAPADSAAGVVVDLHLFICVQFKRPRSLYPSTVLLLRRTSLCNMKPLTAGGREGASFFIANKAPRSRSACLKRPSGLWSACLKR